VPAPLASAPADRTPASAAAVVKTTARLRSMSPPPAGWARPGSRKEPGPGRCYEVSRLGQRAARRELREGDLDALGIPRLVLDGGVRAVLLRQLDLHGQVLRAAIPRLEDDGRASHGRAVAKRPLNVQPRLELRRQRQAVDREVRSEVVPL